MILKNEKGFTLIELIMIIVILGILAAMAIPRYVSVQQDARIAAVNGLAGGVRAAAAIVHAKSVLEGEDTSAAASVTMEGTAVATVYGYPATADIDNALNDFTGFTFVAATATFTKDNAPTPANCSVDYTEPAAVNTAPTFTVVTSGC
jgi:MSHA pilin protein MshA